MTEHLRNFLSSGSTFPTSGNFVPANPGFFRKISLYLGFRFPTKYFINTKIKFKQSDKTVNDLYQVQTAIIAEDTEQH